MSYHTCFILLTYIKQKLKKEKLPIGKRLYLQHLQLFKRTLIHKADIKNAASSFTRGVLVHQG